MAKYRDVAVSGDVLVASLEMPIRVFGGMYGYTHHIAVKIRAFALSLKGVVSSDTVYVIPSRKPKMKPSVDALAPRGKRVYIRECGSDQALWNAVLAVVYVLREHSAVYPNGWEMAGEDGDTMDHPLHRYLETGFRSVVNQFKEDLGYSDDEAIQALDETPWDTLEDMAFPITAFTAKRWVFFKDDAGVPRVSAFGREGDRRLTPTVLREVLKTFGLDPVMA